MYYRVFAANQALVPPEELLSHLHDLSFRVTGHFRGDEQGWFRAELIDLDADARFELQRYLADEEGIRHQLNTWAAWLETARPDEPQWMQQIIGTTQVFTLQCASDDADEESADALAVALCRFLATETAGIYQIDGRGFFTAAGKSIVAEEAGDLGI